MASSLRLEGAREMDAVLKGMATSTARRTSERAMARALEPVADAARAAAPRASGVLAKSIAVSKKLTKRQAREARSTGIGRDDVVVYVGPSAPHSHLVEFGTGPRHHKSGKFVGAMPPQPFMRPAWDANRATVLARLTDDLRAEIEKTMARAAKRSARKAARAAR